ncbi:MAG TPA: ribosome maturation factor RimP [Terriglobales bacterium]|nr:ribosome maturation factor RimP [Terriglobales bacterium]
MALELERVREIAARVASSSGLELVDVEFRGGGKSRMLRITIDKPAGVTHEDCANVSCEVGTILDVEDAVPGSYLLEVSSPGLDRQLSCPAEFERFVGRLTKLTVREPINGNRHFEGRLESARDGRITVILERRQSKSKGKRKQQASDEGPRVEIELANVEKANLVPEI